MTLPFPVHIRHHRTAPRPILILLPILILATTLLLIPLCAGRWSLSATPTTPNASVRDYGVQGNYNVDDEEDADNDYSGGENGGHYKEDDRRSGFGRGKDDDTEGSRRPVLKSTSVPGRGEPAQRTKGWFRVGKSRQEHRVMGFGGMEEARQRLSEEEEEEHEDEDEERWRDG